jgi:sugar lactone lactonase YvrE
MVGFAGRSSAQNVYDEAFRFDPTVGIVDPTGLFNPVGVPNPWGLAIDPLGNVYVADQSDNTVRRIAPDGTVTTIAGTPGVHGTKDGPGPTALFWGPEGVAVDPNGNVFVSDTLNNTIRKITPDGWVSTLAGQPVHGSYADGKGGHARFYFPCELGSDAAGNLYVADWGNSVVRKITPQGVVTTFAGQPGLSGSADGPGSKALFGAQGPEGLCLDAYGDVYVTDSANNTVRKITPDGIVSTLAGMAGVPAGSKDGVGSAARFNYPIGIGVDSLGNVYVADTYNVLVRQIATDGTVTTLAGKPGQAVDLDGGGGDYPIFDYPSGLVVGRDDSIYIADPGNNVIARGCGIGTPRILAQPMGQTIAVGATAVLSVIADQGDPGLVYQWLLNGELISDGGSFAGTRASTLEITGAGPGTDGAYVCLVSNAEASVRSSAAIVSAVGSPDPGRLINLSCRASVGSGANELFVGFAVGGKGAPGAETLLLRASGPALAPFGLSGLLPDPLLQLVGPAGVIASDSGWRGSPAVAKAAAAAGSFPWRDPASADSALLQILDPGTYSATIAGASDDGGVALAELYDTTPLSALTAISPRLVNLSARSPVGTEADVLIAGFVIGGTTSMTVLIRASGPALIPFGVAGTLPDPRLQVLSAGQVIASNTGWAGNSGIAAAAAAAGAFSWGGSFTADSALLLTLAPGAYTAEVSGATGDTGEALIEIYEIY